MIALVLSIASLILGIVYDRKEKTKKNKKISKIFFILIFVFIIIGISTCGGGFDTK